MAQERASLAEMVAAQVRFYAVLDCFLYLFWTDLDGFYAVLDGFYAVLDGFSAKMMELAAAQVADARQIYAGAVLEREKRENDNVRFLKIGKLSTFLDTSTFDCF